MKHPVILSLLLAGSFVAAPPASAQTLPGPEAFTELLGDVVEPPRVDYASLQERRGALDAYLATLAAVSPGTLQAASREARLAFWINAYNACMLRLVVDHYPIEKSGGLFDWVKNAVADRPDNSVWQIDDTFTRDHCRIAGEDRSQDEIEHEILRPIGDPRIHFAVNCAALSCPPLRTEAYAAGTLDEQLDEAVRSFVADADHFRLREGDPPVLTLNRVLDWYGEDFGGADGLKDFFEAYVTSAQAELLRDPATRVEFFDYDWTLNDTES